MAKTEEAFVEEIHYSPKHIRKITPYLNELSYVGKNKKTYKLSMKNRCFAWYYCFNGFNKSDAFRRSHKSAYNPKTHKLQMVKDPHNPGDTVDGTKLLKNPLVKRAVELIQAEIERQIKSNMNLEFVEQLYIQATYDPSMFVDLDGKPKIKSLKQVPKKYRCCVESIEKKYYGKNAHVSSIVLKLVDRDKARKYLLKLCPGLLVPEELHHIHKTIDKDGNQVGFDVQKKTDEELLTEFEKLNKKE